MGGGEKHVVDLSNELAKRGHDVFVAVAPSSPLRQKLAEIPAANIQEFPLRNALDIPSAIKIAKFVREKNVELINAHFAKDYPVAAFAARRAGVPFVITRHVLFPMNKLHRFSLRDVRFVIAPSNAAAESLRDQGLFPDDKIVTIRYGLDVENFHMRDRKSHDGFVIGSIGNLDPVKGFDILIRAAAIISKAKPDVSLKIVGEDRSRDRRNEIALRNLVDELDVGGIVEFGGWSNNIADVLSDFDIFVSASRSESFGFVISEAMLAGVPVVATETEGAKEIISSFSLGRLVPMNSPSAIADGVLRLIEDNRERSLLASSGREYVTDNFSLERMICETEELYRRLIAV